MDAILEPNTDSDRFALFPIKYRDLWAFYLEARSMMWVPSEIKDLPKDLVDWRDKLTDNERHFIEMILAFFAQADGIVNENLVESFIREIHFPEAKCFYGFQYMIENIHAEMYSILIDTYITDATKKSTLFHAIKEFPCIQKKADWALKWIHTGTFAERLLAFACVEGIFFSGSFAAIYWLRKRGLMYGLAHANQLISQDEGLHQQFACYLYRKYITPLAPETALAIVTSACDLEKAFQTEALSVELIGINANSMCAYIEYVSDYLLTMIGLPKHYQTENPFDFMEMLSLDSCENFFERGATNYIADSHSTKTFSTEADF